MDHPYHTLLRRQLRKIFGESFCVPEEWQRFVKAVNTAYREPDTDLNLLERSLELSSQELLQANSDMRAITQNLEHEVEKRARSLEESEIRYRELYENIIDMVILVDRNNHIQMANPRFNEYIGISDAESLDVTFISIVHPDDAPRVDAQMMAKLLEGSDVKDFQFRILKRKNITLDVECNAHVIKKDGKLIGFQMVIRDITARKQAEKALQESETKLQAIFDTVGTGILIIDRETLIIIEANQTAMEMTGLPKERIIGQICHLLVCPAEVGKCPVKDLGQSIDHSERKLLHADGYHKEILKTVYPITIKGRNCFLENFIDISDRKLAEVELQRTLGRLRNAFGATVQVLVSAVETRDPYTAGHQIRSSDLARAIATETGLSQEQIDGIRIAGTIHDIGKRSIPSEILAKQMRLSEIELPLVKQHALKGYEILKDVESPWPLSEIVYQHHERMDGSGYPRNLKGAEILIEARILSVADVVEAMASHRPYRPALGLNAALT